MVKIERLTIPTSGSVNRQTLTPKKFFLAKIVPFECLKKFVQKECATLFAPTLFIPLASFDNMHENLKHLKQKLQHLNVISTFTLNYHSNKQGTPIKETIKYS